MLKKLENRLFVPLTREAFEWFSLGKKWEIRKLNVGQYNLKNLHIGRDVELRLGYQPGSSIWGKITEVEIYNSVDELINEIVFTNIIPTAKEENEAKQFIEKYVGRDNQIIAFKVDKKER